MSDYTRDYYRGRSFNFANEWAKGTHYFNDEYNTDFVSYKGALLVCNISHMSSTSNEPTLIYGDPDNPKIPTGVRSEYWDFVTGGTPGPMGGIFIPKYNQETGMLSWTIVNGDNATVPDETLIKGKDGVTPKFRVNSLGYWEVSYDNENSWSNTGTKAKGDKGDPLTYNDLTPTQIANLQAPAVAAAAQVAEVINEAELTMKDVEEAIKDARKALEGANSAISEANKATTAANKSLANSELAISKAESATTKVNSAISDATDATRNAEKAADRAYEAATRADQNTNCLREVVEKCIWATDQAHRAAHKVLDLLGLVEQSRKDADSALDSAKKALKKAEKASELIDQVTSDAEKATDDAKAATAQLQEALDAANKAAKDAADFKETATKAIEDVKKSAESAIEDLSEEAQKQLQELVESYQEILNQLKEDTEAALKAAQDKLDELYNKIEAFIDEYTKKLHDLHEDVDDAIARSRRATDDAKDAALTTLRHLDECKKQCELTKEACEKATAAADRAEASADACDSFVTEYQPQIDKVIKHIKTLVGQDKNKSVRDIAVEELAKQLIPENANEALDTLEEIAAWIQNHPDDASAMNADIEELKKNMGIGEEMINSEIQRSKAKDEEHDTKITDLSDLVEEIEKQGTAAIEKGENVIKTLGMNEDGTYKEFTDSHYMKGDDANDNHILTFAQALIALDAKLYEVASDTTDWSGILDAAIKELKKELSSSAEEMFDTKVDKDSVGVAEGVASLDTEGKVPIEQISSYFDDVKDGYMDTREFTEVSPSGETEVNPHYMHFFANHENGEYIDLIEGESDKLYIDKQDNILYRWSGSKYVKLSFDIAELEVYIRENLADTLSDTFIKKGASNLNSVEILDFKEAIGIIGVEDFEIDSIF